MHTTIALLAFMAVLLMSGCATITSSETQPVTVTTQNEMGETIDQVKCTLRNDRGEWQVQTPGFASVRRSSQDLLVECKKEGHPDGLLRAISRVAGGMFGNIIFGGGVGAIIDHSNGKGYNYPDALPVKMGQTVTVDRATQDAPPEQKPPSDQARQ